MADQTAIEWCDSTFNGWIGCTRVSPACDHCYAAVSAPARVHGIAWGAGQPRQRTSPGNWKLPLRWNAEPFWSCSLCGWRGGEKSIAVGTWGARCPLCMSYDGMQPARRRVFCASLADVFDNEVDPQWRADLWELIARTPNLDWLLLTKRIGNVAGMLPVTDSRLPGFRPWNFVWPWSNVWLGATICNQAEADRDIPKLLATPAAVRFLSMEPLLGLVDLEHACELAGIDQGKTWTTSADPMRLARAVRYGDASRLDWVIAGGESGTEARPMHPSWVRALRDQCAAAGVPFLFKQWGEWGPYNRGTTDDSGFAVPYGTDTPMQRFGKKLAGRTLDGATHTEFPEIHHA